MAQTMGTGEVWFVVLIHEVSWTCHGAGVWSGAHPHLQPELPLLPGSLSLGILHCQLAAPLLEMSFRREDKCVPLGPQLLGAWSTALCCPCLQIPA